MIREDDLVIIGDEAWTPEELERRERTRARKRGYYRRWRERNPERARQINREHMRRKRGGGARKPAMSPEERLLRSRDSDRRRRMGGDYRVLHVTASLHGLACTGPTADTGCRCKKKLIVRVADEAAA